MLKNKLESFYACVERARAETGESPAKIADAVMAEAFPQSYDATRSEGCDDMLRRGVIESIKRYITKPTSDERQQSFNDIAEDIMPYVEPLSRSSYLVPSAKGSEIDDETRTLGFYVPVADLVNDPVALRAARDFMAQKTAHMESETQKLSDLLEYVEARA